MAETNEKKKMLKPLFLIKPGSMSRKDILRAERLSGICIVECAEPDSARYQELPMSYDLGDQARAALSLMRKIVTNPSAQFQRSELTQWFVTQLLSWQVPAQTSPVQNVKR